MSITLENSTNKVIFGGDASIEREAADVLVSPGTFKAEELHATSAGVRFPDNSLQTTAATGGGGGGAPTGVLYDCVSRYQVVATTGYGTWLTTSAPVHYGLTWARSGTDLTITETAHGHAIGDMVIARNTNVDWQSVLITAVTTNSFTFTCAASGGTSGTTGAYSMGYTYAHVGAAGAVTGGTITAPSGTQGVQLMGIHTHLAANTRTGSTYDFTIPAQPQGAWTGNDNVIIPMYSVRQDSTNLVAASIGIASSVSGNWQVFRMSAMTPTTTGFHINLNF